MSAEEAERRLATLERRLAREREARLAAEQIAESGMRELYQRSRHLELLEAIAAHANGCDDPAEAIALTLRQICEFCDWPVGHALSPVADPTGGCAAMTSTGIFHAADPRSYATFEAASLGSRFRPHEGLPGRVWRSAEPVWLTDVATDDNFSRKAAAAACGLHAGFGLPVRVGESVALVLEFFSPRRLEADALLVQTLGQACAQLARVLERAEALRQAEIARAELERLVQIADEARNAAEQASETKSRFLANMSHEIRTPLNGVLGMVQAMERDDLSALQRGRLDLVRQCSEGLLAILNDVLDLSKVEAGALQLEARPFDLLDVLAVSAGVFRPQAEAKGLRLDLFMPEETARWRLGDATRVRQLVQNLLSNAVKFTDAGGVRLSVREIGDDGLHLEVRDTGIGIAPDQREMIFAPFAQADDSITRRFGGTGLGLPICRELAAAMGGEITVESAPGGGSTFAVRLALATCHPPSLADQPVNDTPEVQALRVLAAEDNPVNRMVLQALLAGTGIELVLAADGEEAVQAWRAGAFDLVLMDIQMPVLDGPAAARIIRTEEVQSGRPRTPILALTANTMTHQVAEYMATGMDGVVAKPIQIAELFAAIEDALTLCEMAAAA